MLSKSEGLRIMLDWLASMINPAFMPHGHCYLWRPDILWTHVLSDVSIAIAYYAISLVLGIFLYKRRKSFPYPEVLGLFIAFIFLCGTTHLMSIYVTWHPAYEAHGWLKALTGIVSVATAVTLIPKLPALLTLPSLMEAYEEAKQNANEAKVLGKKLELELSLRHKVIEYAPFGIILLDSKGTMQLVNEALTEQFGYEPDELIGQPIEMLVPANKREGHVSDRDGYIEDRQLSRRMAPNREVQGQHKNGDKIPVEVGLAAMEEGAQSSVVAMVVDVRERHDAQQRIEAQLKELQSINAELDNFAYIASHDLKSPLRGIEQLASWIEEDLQTSLDPETRDHLHLMRNRIKRMERLLDDLLEYSRVGRTADETIDVDTRGLVGDIFDLANTSQNFRLQMADDMPVLKTQNAPLALVLRNLITNAIKHHDKPNGLITVSTQSTPEGVEFNITDDGPGISRHQHERVFKIFQTLRPRDEVEGSGIGLALVVKALESVGGSVTLESDGERGCTFRFLWPTTLLEKTRTYSES